MMYFPGTVVITHDPVTLWERFNLVLSPEEEGFRPSFANLDPSQRAEGGYYRQKFAMNGDPDFLASFFFGGLGRHVETFTPDSRKIWEGKLYEMTMHVKNADLKVSLKDLYNRVWMRYRITGGTATCRSTAQNDTASQNVYGIKEYVLSGGELESLSVADQLCARVLALSRKPQVFIEPSTQQAMEPSLDITAWGYFETLSWRIYNQTATTGNQGASSEISDILSVCQYVASSQLTANATAVSRVYDVDRTAGGIIMDIARLGDSASSRWLLRMLNDRILYYAPAAPATSGGA